MWINKILDFLKTLKNIVKIRILPYHSYAGSKYEALSAENTLPKELPNDEEIKRIQMLADMIVGNV